MTLAVPSTSRKLLVTAISIPLGLWAFYMTTTVTKEFMDSMLKACLDAPNNPKAFVEQHHDYEPLMGGTFACLMTQFLHALVKSYPAGLIVWLLVILTAQPIFTMITIESGRRGAIGPITYPTVLLMLVMLIGIGVIFPSVVLPAYCWGRLDPTGAVSLARAKIAIPFALPFLILSILAFAVDSDSSLWTFVAGITVNPGMALTSLLLWKMTPPEKPEPKLIDMTTNVLFTDYATQSALGVMGWIFLLNLIVTVYGSDVSTLRAELWTQAHPAVAFMTIDFIATYLGLLLYLAYCRLYSALQMLMLTPLVGPGAAGSLALAQLELIRGDALKTKTK